MSKRSQTPIAVVPPTRRTLFSVTEMTQSKMPTARDIYSSSSGFREDSYENSETSISDSLAGQRPATGVTTPGPIQEHDRSDSGTELSRKESRCALARPRIYLNDDLRDYNSCEEKKELGSYIRNSGESIRRPNRRATTMTSPRLLEPGKRTTSTSQSCILSDFNDSYISTEYSGSNYDGCQKSDSKKTILKPGEIYRRGRSKSSEESRFNSVSTSYLDQGNVNSCLSLATEYYSTRTREMPSPSKRKSSLSGRITSSKQSTKTSLYTCPSTRDCSPTKSSKGRSENKFLQECGDIELLRSSRFIEVPRNICWADLPDHDVRILKTMTRRRREQRMQEQIAHAFRELWREEKETRDKELEYYASQYASWVEETRCAEAASRAAARRSRIARERRAARVHADGHRQQHLRSEQRINKLADDKACEIWSRAAAQHGLAAAAAASRIAAESVGAARRREEEERLHERITRAAKNRAGHLDNVVDRVSAENAMAAELGKRARAFRSSCARARARQARQHADAVAAHAESVVCERMRSAKDSVQMALLTAQLRDTIREQISGKSVPYLSSLKMKEREKRSV